MLNFAQMTWKELDFKLLFFSYFSENTQTGFEQLLPTSLFFLVSISFSFLALDNILRTCTLTFFTAISTFTV
jgi:hypothetical protein